jgi:diketogulonate reductase-like aldo/keto reductase
MTTPAVEAHGARIPIVGFGTWTLRGRECAQLVEQALAAGYRHVDTAQMYDNEKAVGDGVRAFGARDQVFITTKVGPENLSARDLARSTAESIARLGVDHVDLLLIHWPNPRVPLKETIPALNKMKSEGYARHIGVSNFTVALLGEAVALSQAPLVCNQIEFHPFLDQSKVLQACKKQAMAVVAYSPIARGGAKGDATLTRIGKAHGKSAAQVSLRWLVQQGIVVIPRTSKAERLKENIALFDFTLDGNEMSEIAALSGMRRRIVDWSYSPQWD